jgi:hypothetical protein
MKLIRAITELLEAKAELLREEAATMQLGVYARGLQDGRADVMETYGFEVAFIGEESDDDD